MLQGPDVGAHSGRNGIDSQMRAKKRERTVPRQPGVLGIVARPVGLAKAWSASYQ
jgi:hypothetical protein